jgi:hypothetical protein
MSAFTSIKSIIRDLLGNVAAYLIKERFKNFERMQAVTCPTLIIHGKSDELIPW